MEFLAFGFGFSGRWGFLTPVQTLKTQLMASRVTKFQFWFRFDSFHMLEF